MKTWACAAAVAVTFVAGSALAAPKTAPNNVGCGLGTLAWEGKEGKGPEILAVTTNGTFGSQTFGISSGTSGCTDRPGEVQRPDKVAMFIGPNIDKLAQDMARGQGEALALLADLIGVQSQDRAAFYAATQQNFGRIFPNEDVTAGEVLASLNTVMAKDPTLRRYTVS